MLPMTSSLKKAQRFQHLAKVHVSRCRWELEPRSPAPCPRAGDWLAPTANAARPSGSGLGFRLREGVADQCDYTQFLFKALKGLVVRMP